MRKQPDSWQAHCKQGIALYHSDGSRNPVIRDILILWTSVFTVVMNLTGPSYF